MQVTITQDCLVDEGRRHLAAGSTVDLSIETAAQVF
jgi:hypothetical protein